MPSPDPFASASDIAAAIRAKQVSASEMLEMRIARIERLDGQINAVVVRDFARARQDAREIDAKVAKGDTALPLLGVPMTVKESFDLAGHPTTWGLEANADHRADEDALVVRKLKAAGAVIMGKTNVPPVLADWQSVNPIHGRTRNPYNLDRSPGGSSGGGAASVAMGFAALEYGSDIGGSIRIPASFCGVFGHKTSHGLVSTRGHAAGGAVVAPTLLSVVGPIGRSAADLALALDATAGPDAESPANALALPPPRHTRVADHRVFIIDRMPGGYVDSSILVMLDDVAKGIERAGATVSRASDLLPDLDQSWHTYQSMLHTITTRRSPTNRQPISSHDWFELLDRQLVLRRRWERFFRDFDVILSPAFGTTAFPHTDEPDWRKRALTVDGRATPYGAGLVWASLATVGNLPSTAVPMGLDAHGLPMGLQVIGPFLGDHTTVAFAGLIARETPAPKLALD